MGAKGIRIEDPGDVRDGLAAALAHKGGPVVVDAVVDPFALASDHKYLRICDLCQELGIIAARCIIAVERERQAKTDACLVPLCPLASMVPVFWR